MGPRDGDDYGGIPASISDGREERVVRAGETVIVPPHQPGEGRLRQIDVQLSPRFVTEWLEPQP